MNSISNGLGMRKTGIGRKPSRPWNPHYYAVSPEFITRSRGEVAAVRVVISSPLSGGAVVRISLLSPSLRGRHHTKRSRLAQPSVGLNSENSYTCELPRIHISGHPPPRIFMRPGSPRTPAPRRWVSPSASLRASSSLSVVVPVVTLPPLRTCSGGLPRRPGLLRVCRIPFDSSPTVKRSVSERPQMD